MGEPRTKYIQGTGKLDCVAVAFTNLLRIVNLLFGTGGVDLFP